MKQCLLILFVFVSAVKSVAQVGIGTGTPHQSALLEVSASNKGFRPPYMSTAQKMAITNPAEGLIVYDYSQQALNVYNTTKGWERILSQQFSIYSHPSDISTNTSGSGNRYGAAVSIGNMTGNGLVLVGVPGNSNREGSAEILVYHPVSGKLIKNFLLNPADLLAGDQFGYAVATDRLNASADMVVAAPFSEEGAFENAGSVYFYNSNTLRNQALAPPARQAANAKFGRSVDIAGNSTTGKGFAIIGAPGANASKGEAYIYEYNPNSLAWEHKATLTDNLGAVADSFGFSVAIHYKADADTGWAFVGAPYDEEGGFPDAGSVTAFRKAAGSSLWTRVGKFSAFGSASHGLFGYALAPLMTCGKVLITAPASIGTIYDCTLSNLSGNVATFNNVPLPNSTSFGFGGIPGVGVSLSAMAAGNNCDEIYAAAGSGSGYLLASAVFSYGFISLYEFDGSSWQIRERQMIDPIDMQSGSGFGKAVSVNSNRRSIVIGASTQSVNGNISQGKIQARQF